MEQLEEKQRRVLGIRTPDQCVPRENTIGVKKPFERMKTDQATSPIKVSVEISKDLSREALQKLNVLMKM